MLKKQIQVGKHYQAKVSSKLVTVRVDEITQGYGRGNRGATTIYLVTNLETGKETTFRSAARFRMEAETPENPTQPGARLPLHGGKKQPTTAKSLERNGEESGDTRLPKIANTTPPSLPDDAAVQTAVPQGKPGIVPNPDILPLRDAITEKVPNPPTNGQSPVLGHPRAITIVPTELPATNTGLADLLRASLAVETAKKGGITPTAEQTAILEVAQQEGLKCLVIGAGAGTGKTATLKMLENVLQGVGQYTAFNRSLVDESKTKFRKAQCNSTHSLAFREVGRTYAHRLNGNRKRSWEVARILGITEVLSIEMGKTEEDKVITKELDPAFLASQIVQALKRFSQSADKQLGECHFKSIAGIEDPSGANAGENNRKVKQYLLPIANKAWEDINSKDGEMPFNHDYYVKIWQLGKPVIAADYILCDESQDSAPVFLDIIQQQTHALVILVGDDNQQIYEWRGAVNAMKAFPDAPRKLLSQSFRFGQIIADVANSILDTLDEPTDLKMSGLPSIPSRVDTVENPRCILCRTNAAAVSTVLEVIKQGKKPHLIGGGDQVIDFVKAAQQLQKGKKTRHPELACFEDWGEVKTYAKTDEGEELKLMVDLIDKFTCETILEALEHMPSEIDADIVVSTAHKSKGREWDTVKLAPDFPTANRMQDSDRRLLYVAATRAKLVLDISECPPFDSFRDKLTGEEKSGIRIRYTIPMPQKEEVEEYLDTVKGEPKPEEEQVPAQLSTSSNNNTGEFTWANHLGAWMVRGPEGFEGKVVKVTKKSGQTSHELLKTCVKQWGLGGPCIYRV